MTGCPNFAGGNNVNKLILSIAMIAIGGTAAAQSAGQSPVLDYSFAELRLVDADNDGDGIEIGGSYEINGPWILVGKLTSLDFGNNVDFTQFEVGGGYVLPWTPDFDLFGTVTLVRAEFDTNFGDADDSGFGIAAGTRGLLTPQLEVRGTVNHINLDDSDTFIELALDYYFTSQFAAGVSVDFGGDLDTATLGARFYFN
jgi:hypothetical protein